jgi:hypothetical protein
LCAAFGPAEDQLDRDQPAQTTMIGEQTKGVVRAIDYHPLLTPNEAGSATHLQQKSLHVAKDGGF